MKVKLCGVKSPEDVRYMNEFGPDYVGFVFAGAKRRVTPQTAAELAEKLDPDIRRVGVFVNEEPETIAAAGKLIGLQAIQLHGDETEADIRLLRTLLPDCSIWKAIRVRNERSISTALALTADLLLLDSFSRAAYGGTGQTADIGVIQKAQIHRPFFLAGGLNRHNIRAMMEQLKPYGVDLSSGIETDGRKDSAKIEAVMKIVRSVP